MQFVGELISGYRSLRSFVDNFWSSKYYANSKISIDIVEKVSNKINVLRITRKSTGGEYSSFLDGRQILLDIQFARKLINDSLKIVKSKVSNEINVFRLN